MGFISTDIATVPAVNGAGEPFRWYVFLLPGAFKSQVRDEVINNFSRLSRELGRENLVVIGADIDRFHFEVIRKYALYLKGYNQNNIPLPSLLVTDTVPSEVRVENGNLNARVMIFPLAQTYLKNGMLSNFLRLLCTTLQDAEAFDDVENLQRDTVIQKWGWIPRYFEFKPSFFGFKVNFSSMLEDLMKNLQE